MLVREKHQHRIGSTNSRHARDARPKWNSGGRRPAERQKPSHRSGRRSRRARGGDSRLKHEKEPPSGASSHHAATEKHKPRNHNHDETPRAARPRPGSSDDRLRGLALSLIDRHTEKCHCVQSCGNTVNDQRCGEGRERSFVRTYGAEKRAPVASSSRPRSMMMMLSE